MPHPIHMRSTPTISLLLATLLLLGCAEGGKENRPISEVIVAANHHLFAHGGSIGFTSFPLLATEVQAQQGDMLLRSDSSYQVSGGSLQDYFIQQNGALTLAWPVPGRGPTNFLGAYAHLSMSQVFFFTDRFAPNNAPNVRLFWGTQTLTTTPDPQGDWHVFSQHAIHSASPVLDPDNVGRSMAGSISISATGVVSGTGTESTGASLTLPGTATAFVDGKVSLILDYVDNLGADNRVFDCGLNHNVILGLDDEQKSPGESGLIGLLRHRSTAPDPALLEGTYDLGIHTLFVDPTDAGTDAANGSITFNALGGFQLSGTGVLGGQGVTFSYAGTYSLQADGGITFTVGGSNQTWKGAIDEEYEVLLIADIAVEAGLNPELNLMLGLRQL